ncbi:MAG: PIN domain-containing protein [Hormoscilla sp. SP5CHS1]|nr:PIN domain-containing protein [Hormoscilla sp. SP12CHS1]MBC6453187.1 PIN domain-containing protein [Hormoscilla sp. SP5CHS1]
MDILSVVLDSCVIFPLHLRDTLLRAVQASLYELHWSQEILDGATRNLVLRGKMTDSQAANLQVAMKRAFSKAMVEVPDELVEEMTNDPGDRHVVAAAVVAKAQAIVTFNLRHFPEESLRSWGIKDQHPDVFLTNLYDRFPDRMAEVILLQAQSLRQPPMTAIELLEILSRQVPEFVNRVRLDLEHS